MLLRVEFMVKRDANICSAEDYTYLLSNESDLTVEEAIEVYKGRNHEPNITTRITLVQQFCARTLVC